ncbi:DUF3617 domain-containing protein [Pseudomonas sp.]|uniref:DUF3617 domain-containing protein n=1 Tax=Pseudomonas sp. TaxID=306 RepID=UPI0035680F09
MRVSVLKSLSLGLCLLPALATAQDIQPGLWEVSSTTVRVDGQTLPDMQHMLEQLKKLPPEQRQMMEQMLAKQGVQLGDQGVRICMSEAQTKAQEIPLQDPNSGCSHEITERSAELWRFRFSCPDGEGEGETRFLSDKEFTSLVKGTYGGQSSSVQSHARWVSTDCGGLQPR